MIFVFPVIKCDRCFSSFAAAMLALLRCHIPMMFFINLRRRCLVFVDSNTFLDFKIYQISTGVIP